MTDRGLLRRVTSVDGHQLVFNVSQTLSYIISRVGGFTDLYNEFIHYKTQSADLGNLPVPDRSVQMEYLTIVDAFGKDKPNHFPKPGAKNEQLHHLHVFDGNTDNELNRWLSRTQSRRSSDTLLFYSFFEWQDCYYFYVLEFVESPEGHDFQSDQVQMAVIVQRASQYRRGVQSGKIA